MSEQRFEDRSGDKSLAWPPAVLELLHDWDRRAAASEATHYELAGRLAKRNIQLGAPIVILTTIIGTSVFATLEEQVESGWRIAVGLVSVLAAVLASLQTFFRFAERAEQHRIAAELWAAIRRHIGEMLALHPGYLHGDPQKYLAALRQRMDETSKQSPAMGQATWERALAKRMPGEVTPQQRSPTT